LEECGGPGGCGGAAEEFLRSVCRDPGLCGSQGRKRGGPGRYAWIEKIIERGVPDGRSRLILYVISRYLLNIKGMQPEDAEAVIDSFIEASCRNHGNCGKIYKSWIRSVLRHVARGGWKPWSLERMQRDDPQLYEIVQSIISQEPS
jgi:hypothetical protein